MQNRSTDNLRFPASLGILFTLAATLVAAVVATAQACEEAAERLVVDAILDERPADANRWLTELDLERARIPSRAFYRALNSWWGASRSGDAKQAAAAVDQMAAAVDELSTRNRQRRTLDSLAAVGIARGHLARVMVASERYTEALATGTRAIDELETYLESSD